MHPNSFIPENTSEWFKERCGMLTASKGVKLMKGGTRPMTTAEIKVRDAKNKKLKALDKTAKVDTRKTIDVLFGDAAETYFDEKVAERINKISKYTPTTSVMQRGLDLELDAIDTFNMITGLNASKAGLFKLNDNVGGSPDFTIGKRKILYVGEIKALNDENHSKLCEIQTVEQLREFDESYFSQLQFNMYVTGAKGGYFIAFDPRAMGVLDDGTIDEERYTPKNFVFCIKILKVKRDEVYIKELAMRIEAGLKRIDEKIDLRNKTAYDNLKWYSRTQQRKSA